MATNQYKGDPGQQAAGKVADFGTSALDYVTGANQGNWWAPIQQAAQQHPEALAQANPDQKQPPASVFGGKAPLKSFASTPSDPPSSSPSGQTQPTPSTLFSPLATQMYLTNTMGPMLQGTANNLQQWNQTYANNAQNNIMDKYLPPQFKAYFNQVNNQQAQMNNNEIASLQNAAASGPALDQMMNTINTIRQQQAQDYEKQLYNFYSQSGTGGLGLGPSSTGAPTNPGSQDGQKSPDGKWKWSQSSNAWVAA